MLKPIHLLRHHGTNKQEKYPRTMPAIVHSTTYNKHNTRHDQHQRGLVSAGHMVAGVEAISSGYRPSSCYSVTRLQRLLSISRYRGYRAGGYADSSGYCYY